MEDSRTVWCGNLPEKITEELLYELFLQAAPLERVKIPTDKDGRKSNYAFITFKHECSVDYATQLLNGTPLFQRRISVKPRGQNNQQRVNQNQNVFHDVVQMQSLLQMGLMMQGNSPQYDRHSPRDDRHHREEYKPYNRHDYRDRSTDHGANRHRNNYNSHSNRNYKNDNRNNRRNRHY